MPMGTALERIVMRRIERRKAADEFVQKGKAAYLQQITNVFFVTISIYFLVIGLYKIESCPGNPLLPRWMILVALLIVIDRVICWRRLRNETKFERTFPKPSIIDSVERIKTWEENRVRSSSRALTGFMTTVRIAILVAVVLGKVWTFEVVLKDQCDHMVSFSILIFCVFSIIFYIFYYLFDFSEFPVL